MIKIWTKCWHGNAFYMKSTHEYGHNILFSAHDNLFRKPKCINSSSHIRSKFSFHPYNEGRRQGVCLGGAKLQKCLATASDFKKNSTHNRNGVGVLSWPWPTEMTRKKKKKKKKIIIIENHCIQCNMISNLKVTKCLLVAYNWCYIMFQGHW